MYLTACSSTYVHRDMRKYVDRYKIYKKDYLGTDELYYPIHFVIEPIDDGDAVGTCDQRILSRNGEKARVVTVDIHWWARVTDSDREVMILHELGHCDLDIHEHTVMKLQRAAFENKETRDV